MKGVLLPFVILALVAAVTLLGFFVFNTIYGKGFEKNIGEIKKIDVIENVIEAFKAYSKLSLIYSSQEAFRESACNGGIISDQPWPWICSGAPNIPKVEDIKQCTGNFSKYFLNIYLGNFSVELPLKVYEKGVDKCIVEVNESDVMGGKYDNGDFWIKCGDVTVSVKGEDINGIDSFNVSYFLINNRFWYLYRKIAEWAKESDYAKCICKAAASCYSCEEAKSCAEKALKALENKFEKDDNVRCEWEKISSCCNTEVDDRCKEPQMCFSWCKNCCVSCHPHCAKETTAFFGSCIPKNLVIYKSKDNEANYNYETLYFSPEDSNCKVRVPSNKFCPVWNEYRLERKDVFVCTDHKYYIPSVSGPIPLQFSIVVQAGFKVPHPSCEKLVLCTQPNCECPDGYTMCNYNAYENGQCIKKSIMICNCPCPEDEC